MPIIVLANGIPRGWPSTWIFFANISNPSLLTRCEYSLGRNEYSKFSLITQES